MLNFIGIIILFLAIKASDAFLEVVFTHFWEWLFAQIDWHLLTRQLKLKMLLLYLEWLLRR